MSGKREDRWKAIGSGQIQDKSEIRNVHSVTAMPAKREICGSFVTNRIAD
jgi:hypothetical protein